MSQYCFHIIVPSENTVRVKKTTPESTDAGQLTGTFHLDRITSQIQDIIKTPTNLKGKEIIEVGEALFYTLFDLQLTKDFLGFYKLVTEEKKQILSVILEINESAMPEVVAYPWELMCLPKTYKQKDIYFATDRKISFYRCRYELDSKKSIKIGEEALKIALVISKPTTDPNLSTIEYQELSQYLETQNPQKVKYLSVMDSRNSYDIVERVEKDQPDIFHFIGHGQLIQENGQDVGQIAFVNDFGEPDWKDARIFSQLFSGHTPKIVILQACETAKQSDSNAFSSVAFRLMLQGIPVVIAMQYKVSNQTAISFVIEFYSKIIGGDSVEIAVQKARSKLAFDKGYGTVDFATPVIYMNAADGYLFSSETNQTSIINPPNNPRIENLRRKKEQLLERIDNLQQKSILVEQQLKATSNLADRETLDNQIKNFQREIDQLYDEIDKIENKMNNCS